MMQFDIWKVLQMLYHVLQISKNTLDLQRALSSLCFTVVVKANQQ